MSAFWNEHVKDHNALSNVGNRHSPIDRWCLMPGKLLRTIIGGKQISKTQDEPQWIVAQGYSQHLQYLDSNKSSTKDLSLPLFEIMLSHNAFDSKSS